MSKVKNESVGGGFQLPFMTRQKIEAFMEAIKLAETDRSIFFSHVTESIKVIEKKLDSGALTEAIALIVNRIEENLIRNLVREKLREVVRKKKGGGGYSLYSPNQGKKNPPKAVADFPTKLMAKRAELSRFPPKDVTKLKRLRHEVETLSKDPKKAVEKEKEWKTGKKVPNEAEKTQKQPKPAKPKKKEESLNLIRSFITKVMSEALFREEEEDQSRWDERMTKLSKAAIEADKKLQTLQKTIEKKGEGVLSSAMTVIMKALKPRKMQVKSSGIKKDSQRQKTYMQFAVTVDSVEVGPFYIFVEDGKPKIEMSQEAKVSLTKVEPENAKLLRAELVTVQEDVMDEMSDVLDAVQKRDLYLDKMETRVDGFVANLNALEISVLKNLLVQKYRGR